MPDDVIALRSYRVHVRKSRIEVVGDDAELVLPASFGSRRLVVPLRDITVVDLTSPTLVEDEVFFRRPPVIPYFFTTGPATEPTTTLLFRTSRRVPPLKVSVAMAPNMDLPFGWWESRSAGGAHVDGVDLRAVDPVDAARRLTSAGARRTDDPAQWLRDHHQAVDDPIEREQLRTEARTVHWLFRASFGLVFGALLAAAELTDLDEVPPVPLGLAGLAGGLGLVLWLRAKRRNARMRADRVPAVPGPER